MASRSSSRSIVLPSTIQPYLQKAAPLILAIGKAVSYAIPVVSACWNAAEKGYTILEPYHPEEFLPMIFGLILIFFGGHFLFTIAAIEAYRISSWSTTKHCFVDLWKSFKVAKEASDKDDKVDANKDGVQDVKVLSAPELVQRKLLVALKAVDPNVVTEASASIYVGLMAAVATLRIEFARTVALGVAIGDVLYRLLYRVLVPALSEIVPREYRKWVVPSLQYACKLVGVSFAHIIQRYISAFHSAMRGGFVFTAGLLGYFARRGKVIDLDGDGVSDVNESSPIFLGVCSLLAALGFWQQVRSGFTLGFPLNILLMPLRVSEYLIWYIVAAGA